MLFSKEKELEILLGDTQAGAYVVRNQAEERLRELYADPELPLTLVSIASDSTVDLSNRQAALLNLKNYVLAGWSPEFDEFKAAAPIDEETKSRVRSSLLELSTTETPIDRKIQSAASLAVSKIANADYPDQWPDLLQTLLGILRANPPDARLHGTLKVLAELVADGLDEAQFFPIAQELVNDIYTVASNEQRRPKLRALAVGIFKECFNTLQVVLEDHKAEIKKFVDESLGNWIDLILNIIKTPLPNQPEWPDDSDDREGGPLDHYRGMIALKVQVSRLLITIRTQFPSILSPRSPALFSSIWDELTRLLPVYQAKYIQDGREDQSRLEDADGLPYSMDFLVLEDLDFMQGCLRAPPVRKELERQLNETQDIAQSWLAGFLRLIVGYAQITGEEEGMWEIDVNVFLAEETSVTANYTARTACGDLIVKLGEWLRERLLEILLLQLHETLRDTGEESWRQQEAGLFMLDQTLTDWQDFERKIGNQLSESFLAIAQGVRTSSNPFLRARAFLVISTLLRGTVDGTAKMRASELMQANLQSIHGDDSEVVQASCVRAIQNYLQVLPRDATLPLQAPIINALSTWLSSKQLEDLSESDELLFTLVESLRDVITLDTRICLTGDGLNVLFSVVSNGAENFQITNLVSETFEEICGTISPLGSEAYTQLCQKVLPSITGAFDVGKMTEENALSSLAADLLTSLTSHAPTPLPPGFVAAVMPKLSLLLLKNTDDELLKSCTLALKNILTHDTPQVLAYTQPAAVAPGSVATAPSGKPGLEIVLQVVDRLLSPSLGSDIASEEVGSLAAALIEHVGPQQLGSYLMPLLTRVANRVATAEKAALVQSLVMVFARLAVSHSAKEVVDFLCSVNVPDPQNPAAQKTGLDVVVPVWLNDATPTLAGYQDIRANVVALTKLFELRDPRFQAILCKGDMVVTPETSGRIMTRSRAKAAPPEQWTSVSAPIKIIKLLVDELSSAASVSTAGMPSTPGLVKGGGDAAADEDGSDEDSDWEDDLGEEELLKIAGSDAGSTRGTVDGETVAFLKGWLRGVVGSGVLADAGGNLTDGERDVLGQLGS
ncbi:MAG: hypothetical protein Q9162_001062 [Coniocarpon cinnabarinum]